MVGRAGLQATDILLADGGGVVGRVLGEDVDRQALDRGEVVLLARHLMGLGLGLGLGLGSGLGLECGVGA